MGDGYSNPVVGAGGDLIRAAIRSLGYRLGLAGWTINQDGSAEFNNVTVRGLVIAAIFRSTNYVAGVSGFQLDGNTGTAELNDLTARGNIIAGSLATATSGGRIKIVPSGTPGGTIEFHSAYNVPPDVETIPATILVDTVPGLPGMEINSADLGSKRIRLSIIPPQVGVPGGVSFDTDATGAQLPAQFVLFSNTVLRLRQTADVSISSTDHAFQIGTDGGLNLCMDNNEIQVRDIFSTTGTLNLQNEGGNLNIGGDGITCPAMRAKDGTATGNVVTASATFVTDNTNGPNYTFTYPPSGRVLVLISSDSVNSAAGFSNMSFRIRDTNAAGTIRFTGGSDESTRKEATGRATVATAAVVTGLPTSGTGFIEGLYLATSGTATFRNADIVVVPVT